jgi:hypothetical protein
MKVGYAAVLLLLFTAGCARVEPYAPLKGAQTVAGQPVSPKPVAKPAPKPVPTPAAPSTPEPTPVTPPAPTETTAPPPAAGTVAVPGVEAAVAPPALDLNKLEERLRETKAIGFFTKIALKNQVDDLLDQFRDYYKGKAKRTSKELRQSFDLLMMKVLSLLQDKDQTLASDIVHSREAIWAMLADPSTFATLDS